MIGEEAEVVLKYCSCCKALVPLTSFYPREREPDGYDPHCTPCKLKHDRRYYLRTRRARIEYGRQYYIKTRASTLREYKQQKPRGFYRTKYNPEGLPPEQR